MLYGIFRFNIGEDPLKIPLAFAKEQKRQLQAQGARFKANWA